MDNIRPERDELDKFRDRKTSKPKTAAKVSAAPKKEVKSGSPFVPFIMVLLVFACSYLAWANYEQREQLQNLRGELTEASGFIGQSKLLLARLEGQLSDTGTEMAESGSVVDKKLAFLDAEMRKLWGVSNDRNKKQIKENSALIDATETKLAALNKSSKNTQAELERVRKSLVSELSVRDERLVVIKKQLDGVSSRVSDVASGSVVALAEVETMKEELVAMNGFKDKLKETGSVIASIDASRQQLVQRVVELERRLSELQAKVEQSSSGTSQPKSNALEIKVPTK